MLTTPYTHPVYPIFNSHHSIFISPMLPKAHHSDRQKIWPGDDDDQHYGQIEYKTAAQNEINRFVDELVSVCVCVCGSLCWYIGVCQCVATGKNCEHFGKQRRKKKTRVRELWETEEVDWIFRTSAYNSIGKLIRARMHKLSQVWTLHFRFLLRTWKIQSWSLKARIYGVYTIYRIEYYSSHNT